MGVLTIGNDRAIASADAAACALLTSDDLVGRVLTEVVVPVEAQRSPHQLSYLVHRAVALLRRRPAPTPRFVLRGIGAAHTAVVVDHLQAEQVLVNLFENALDAARDEVIVRVLEGASPAQAVCIEVADDGDGVPPEMARKIFDPFFTTKAHGTGLGLAIARDLTRLNGGDLRLVPRSGGAVFHLLFSSTLAPIRAEW
jgi:C4-dicarboxylate-specific signal transduction histidine kinase